VEDVSIREDLRKRLEELGAKAGLRKSQRCDSLPPRCIQLQSRCFEETCKCDRDHYEYWAWSAEVFREFEASSQLIKEVKEALFLSFHICLARLRYTSSTRESIVLNRVIDEVVDDHVKHIISNKFVIGVPVAVATFKALLKTYIKLYGPESSRKRGKKGALRKDVRNLRKRSPASRPARPSPRCTGFNKGHRGGLERVWEGLARGPH
jgi:hypothetical protein